jgi:hypothetical protein
MRTRSLTAVLAATLCASCAPLIAVEPIYGELEAEGDISLTNAGSTVVDNSLADLGIDGAEAAPGLRADFKWGIPHLTLATQSSEWSGTGVATDFGDITGLNVAVDSEMELALHRALLTFDLLPTDMFELGLGFGISAVDVKASITDIDPATPGMDSESVDETLPIPVLALRGGFSVWRLEFEALVAGMTAAVEGDDVTFLDTDLAARLRLFGLGPLDLLLSAGYRKVDLDLEYDEDNGDAAQADLTFDGPYVGLRISF